MTRRTIRRPVSRQLSALSLPRLSGGILLLGLAACGGRFPAFEEREPWRRDAEAACLQSGAVKEGPAVSVVSAIDGPGMCGIDHPLRVEALGDQAPMAYAAAAAVHPASFGAPARGSAPALQAAVTPAATLACPMVAALGRFAGETLQPAALHWFGQPVVAIKQISAYSCRGMNDNPLARISEHAFGNALDIAAFTLADGHTITVRNGWRGTPEEQGFLHDVEEGACAMFATVLAPGSNAYHEDHMHLDLMRRSSGRLICQPRALAGEAAAFLSGSGHGGPRLAAAKGAEPARRAPSDRDLLRALIARDR
jgi:hypothetical protein